MEEFDFLVIGSGSGLDVANVAANQGQSVAVTATTTINTNRVTPDLRPCNSITSGLP